MPLEATRFSRGRLSVCHSNGIAVAKATGTSRPIPGAETGISGVEGWTWVEPTTGVLYTKGEQTPVPTGTPFNEYRVTLDANGRHVEDALILQSSESGLFVTSARQSDARGQALIGFAATASSYEDAAILGVYRVGNSAFYWWFDQASSKWLGLTQLADPDGVGKGVVAAVPEIAIDAPYLLPWSAKSSDPDWVFTPPFGWNVAPFASLTYVDFTRCSATSFPFDFSGCALTAANLLGKSFGDAKFVACDLSSTRIAPPLGAEARRRIDFTQAKIAFDSLGSDWRFMNLTSAKVFGYPAGGSVPAIDASGSTLDGLSMAKWKIGPGNFEGASLVGSDFQHSDLQGASFRDAALTNLAPAGKALRDRVAEQPRPANLAHSNLTGATFDGAKLTGVHFTDAVMPGLDFTAVAARDLTSVQLAGATLTGSVFNHTKMMGASLTGATLDGARLIGVQFGAADSVPGADLSDAYLPNAVLSEANLNDVTLPYAQIYGGDAKLDKANLAGAKLANANLAGMDLGQAHLVGAVLDGANLIGCKLNAANLTNVTMASASLQGVDFTKAKLIAAHLPNAAVALEHGVILFALPASEFAASLDQGEVDPALAAQFSDRGYPLRSQARVTVETPGLKWTIRVEPPKPHAPGLGYIEFALLSSDGMITTHGTRLAVARLGPGKELEVVQVDIHPTQLDSTSFSDSTICPNQRTYKENQQLGATWSEMMTAPRLAKPPACVPSPEHWCPPSGS